MAGDLRTLGTILKLITYLDRIARYGYDIAKVTLEMGDRPHIAKLVTIPHMARICDEMIDQAITAFMTNDAERALRVFPRDEEVDALYEQVFRECLTYMMEDNRLITQCAHYILVIRHLERIADNACKIAEKVVYMATGKRRLDGAYKLPE
jgi:phosphate transport system protein